MFKKKEPLLHYGRLSQELLSVDLLHIQRKFLLSSVSARINSVSLQKSAFNQRLVVHGVLCGSTTRKTSGLF